MKNSWLTSFVNYKFFVVGMVAFSQRYDFVRANGARKPALCGIRREAPFL